MPEGSPPSNNPPGPGQGQPDEMKAPVEPDRVVPDPVQEDPHGTPKDPQVQDTAPIARSTSGGQSRNTLVVGRALHFAIKYYDAYDAWDDRPHGITEEQRRGQLMTNGLIKGDRASTRALQNGYVYAFKRSGTTWELEYAWEVKRGQYQRVTVNGQSVDYDTKIGRARPYARIANYFPDTRMGLPTDERRVVPSEVKLTDERLFTADYAYVKERLIDYKYYSETKQRKTGIGADDRSASIWFAADATRTRMEANPISGPQVRDNLETRREAGVDLFFYHYQAVELGGELGCYLFFPDALKELERRAKIFQDVFWPYFQWENDERRGNESFCYQAVQAILKQNDGYEDKADTGWMQRWKEQDGKNYRKYYFPVYWAIEHLVAWLKHPYLAEVLADYSFGTDEEQLIAHEAYAKAIKDIEHTRQGREYLVERLENNTSYFNQSTDWDEVKETPRANGTTFFRSTRSVSKTFFSTFETYVKVIWGKNGASASRMISRFAKNKTGIRVIERTVGEAYDKVLKRLEIDEASLDEQLAKVGASMTGVKNSLVLLLDVVNIGLAIWSLADVDPDNDDNWRSGYVKGGLALTSAVIGTSTGGFVAARLKTQIPRLAAGTLLERLALIGGFIDAGLAVYGAVEAGGKHDFDAMAAWIGMGIGGLLSAAGSIMILAGWSATVGTAGVGWTVGAVCLVIGAILGLIGGIVKIFVEDDEIDQWILWSMFGDDGNHQPGDGDLKAHIKKLWEILYKFKLGADFENSGGGTKVKIDIELRGYGKHSQIVISHVNGIGESGVGEMLFGRRGSTWSGVEGGAGITIDLDDPRGVRVWRDEEGRITKLQYEVRYRHDVDRIRGGIAMLPEPGAEPVYKRDFNLD